MYWLTKFVQKIILAIFIISFAFVSVYVPNSFSPTQKVEAALATEFTAWLSNAQHMIGNVFSAAKEVLQIKSWAKDGILDGLAWMIAKAILSRMTGQIVSWINSGFNGSPAFVQDLDSFLLDVADNELGMLLEEIGGPFSFICEPFKLDISITIATIYAQERESGSAGACTLTGALENIENFIGGDFASGGWDAFFRVTQEPEIYTPAGAAMSARDDLNRLIVNAQGEEKTLLEFGDGFLSRRECTELPGPPSGGVPAQKCRVLTPGTTIAENLNRHLNTGTDSLIAADEIDEIINALFAQIAQAAITGAGGLLGLSGGGNSGSQYLNSIGRGRPGGGVGTTTGSYLGQLIGGGGVATSSPSLRNTIANSLALEERYLDAADEYYPQLITFAANPSIPQFRRTLALTATIEIEALKVKINRLISELEAILALIDRGDQMTAASRFSGLNPPPHGEGKVNGDILRWQQILVPPVGPIATSTPPGGG